MDDVVAPPYDVIDGARRDALYDTSPFNVTRLILNRESHAAAAEQYEQWLGDGVLTRDQTPAFYLYAQDFQCEGAKRRVGVIGALHLEPFSAGVVLPHETTFAHHKEDRLALTEAAKANLSPIFGVYSNPDFVLEPEGGWDGAADIDVIHEGVRHRLWAVSDAASVGRIEEALAGRTVFIADGHHRYETALNYHAKAYGGQELPLEDDAPGDDEAPGSHVLAFLAAFEDPGMVILPTHRELLSSGGADHQAFERALATDFRVETFAKNDSGRDGLLGGLAGCGVDTNGFAVALRDLDHYLLISSEVDKVAAESSPLSALDVSALHTRVLGRAFEAAGGKEAELAYSVDPLRLLDRVDSRDLEGAFLMNATRPEQMAAVCHSGELMPQKSTYFFPKLLTGLVFHSLKRDGE